MLGTLSYAMQEFREHLGLLGKKGLATRVAPIHTLTANTSKNSNNRITMYLAEVLLGWVGFYFTAY